MVLRMQVCRSFLCWHRTGSLASGAQFWAIFSLKLIIFFFILFECAYILCMGYLKNGNEILAAFKSAVKFPVNTARPVFRVRLVRKFIL